MPARGIALGRGPRALVVAMTLACVAGCRTPITEMIVVVDTDYAIGTEIETVHVQVSPTGQSRYFQLVPAGVDLGPPGMETRVHRPFSFAVVPRAGGIADTMDIVLTALASNSATLSTRTVRVGFIEGETHFVRVFLPRSCQPTVCTTDSTCTETGCQTIAVTTGTPLTNPGSELDGSSNALDAAPNDLGGDVGSTDVADAIDGGNIDAVDVPAPQDARDASDVVDSGNPTDAVDVNYIPLVAPRLIAPMSLSHVPTLTPLLSFLPPATGGGTQTRVEICRDRACNTVLQTLDSGAGGTNVRATFTAHGVYYWHARGLTATGVGASTSATWPLSVDGPNSPTTYGAWGSMFDLNGDGFADLVVAANQATGGGGAASIYYGSPTGVPTTPALIINGVQAPRVTNAGDVNGDGYADLVLSYPAAGGTIDGGMNHPGAVDVFLGSSAGISTTNGHFSLTPLNAGTSGFGQLAQGVGDMNGDGYGDLVLVSDATGGGYSVALYPGGMNGPTTPAGAPVVVNAMDSIGAVGDLDGDGFAEFAIGDTTAFGGQGQIRLQFGASTLNWSLIPVSNMTVSEYLGITVTAAGDMDGDGLPDIFVGTNASNPSMPNVALVRGRPQNMFRAALPTQGIVAVRTGSVAEIRVAAGDMDGDGVPDGLAGGWSGVMTDGAAVFFHGTAMPGFVGSPTGVMPVSNPALSSSHFGEAVGIADFNGDGIGEVVVSAPWLNSFIGAVYVFGNDPRSAPASTLNVPTNQTFHTFGQALATSR